MDEALLIEVLTDLQVELKAIHECLLAAEVPDLTLQAKREDAQMQRGEFRKDVVKRLAELRALSPNAL